MVYYARVPPPSPNSTIGDVGPVGKRVGLNVLEVLLLYILDDGIHGIHAMLQYLQWSITSDCQRPRRRMMLSSTWAQWRRQPVVNARKHLLPPDPLRAQ
jgi:hypothetical protein